MVGAHQNLSGSPDLTTPLFRDGLRQGPRKVTKIGGSKRGRLWRAREREPITGVWGRSPQWGPGAEPLVRGSGGRIPPEAEKLFAFRRPLEAANLPLFSLYCRLSKLLKFSIQHWQWGIDLGVTWVCVHDLTWHQNDLKVDKVTTWLDLTWLS